MKKILTVSPSQLFSSLSYHMALRATDRIPLFFLNATAVPDKVVRTTQNLNIPTFLSTVAAVLAATTLSAQVERSTNPFDLINLERHQVKLNLVAPGLSYELGIFKNVSASTSFGLGYAKYMGGRKGYTFGYAWHTRMRWYHNLERRKALGKNVSGNSGNYLAAARSIFWAPLQISNSLAPPKDFALGVYGGVYGIQRTYEKGFNFNAELGGGYFRGDGIENGYGALLSFSFGWVATKRRTIKPTFE